MERDIDELQTRDVVSKAILEQDGKSAFLIFDEGIRKTLKAADGYAKKPFTTQGTISEIAKKLEQMKKFQKEPQLTTMKQLKQKLIRNLIRKIYLKN